MTLSDFERPKCTVAEKMHLLEPTAQIWMKIDQYMQRQKCRPVTLVSWNIRCMQILTGVPFGGDLKWEGGCWRWQFLAIWVATSSETSEIKPAILYDDMLPVVCLWLIAKWMSIECPFHVKFGFRTSSLRFRGFDFEAYVKTNECRPTLSAAKM